MLRLVYAFNSYWLQDSGFDKRLKWADPVGKDDYLKLDTNQPPEKKVLLEQIERIIENSFEGVKRPILTTIKE